MKCHVAVNWPKLHYLEEQKCVIVMFEFTIFTTSSNWLNLSLLKWTEMSWNPSFVCIVGDIVYVAKTRKTKPELREEVRKLLNSCWSKWNRNKRILFLFIHTPFPNFVYQLFEICRNNTEMGNTCTFVLVGRLFTWIEIKLQDKITLICIKNLQLINWTFFSKTMS